MAHRAARGWQGCVYRGWAGVALLVRPLSAKWGCAGWGWSEGPHPPPPSRVLLTACGAPLVMVACACVARAGVADGRLGWLGGPIPSPPPSLRQESIRGYPMDGVVLLCGCDKTTPGPVGGPAWPRLHTGARWLASPTLLLMVMMMMIAIGWCGCVCLLDRSWAPPVWACPPWLSVGALCSM
jgi:hypothetical protein